MNLIGGFRSDLSITRKTDGNLGNVSAGVVFQSRVSTKTVVKPQTRQKLTQCNPRICGRIGSVKGISPSKSIKNTFVY